MRDGNKWSLIGFILGSVLWTWVAFTYFQSWCLVQFRIPGETTHFWGYYESYQLLVGLILLFTGVGTLLCLRSRRTTLMLVINIVTPLELYLVPVVYDYFPALVWAMGILLAAALLFYAWVIFAKSKGRAVKKCAWYLHGSRVLAGLVLLPALVYIFGMNKGMFSAAQVEAASMETVEEHTIDNHIEELCLFADPDWENVSLAEKAELLQTVAAIETRYLGLKRVPQVRVVCLEYGLLGKYRPDQDMIYVSADVVQYGTPDEALEVTLHEIYHAYQRQQADLYLNVPEEYRELRLLRNAETYLEEFNDYTTGSEDYDTYAAQWVETSARSYAQSAMQDYSDRVMEYLGFEEEETIDE